ncbi:MAG: ABC transporter permease [Gemmatimonadaceae bacterium]
MNQFVTDVRYGLRMLLKTPSASAMVLIALSLGIGLSALMFSLINGGVLPTLPVKGGDRVMMVARAERMARTPDDFMTWSTRQRSFEQLGGVSTKTVTLAIEGSSTSPVHSAAITPSMLSVLATAPAMGRPFTERDALPGAPAVVLVSYKLWREQLAGAPNAIGRVIRVDGRPAEVIGVMPEGFAFPWYHDVWTPLDMDPVRGGAVLARPAEGHWVVGRLRPGVRASTAATELTSLTRDLDQLKRGIAGPASIVKVYRFTDLFGGGSRAVVLAGVLLGVAFLVLLVACSNVANVLLARAVARRREIVIRLAVGASRTRILTQLLAEMAVLALGGAVGGTAIALIGTQQITAITPPGMPYWIAFRVNWPVLGFTVLVSMLATVMAGLMPAIQASRANTHELLKSDARGSSSFHLGRVMRRLVGVEIAFSFMLLVLAGLFIRSGTKVARVDFAFDPAEVYHAYVGLPEAGYEDPAAKTRLADQLQQTLGSLPPVAGAALSTGIPGIGSSDVVRFRTENAAGTPPNADEWPMTRSIVATPSYFPLFRAHMVAGRNFDSRDREGAPAVAVVNDAFAKRYLPSGALDRRIQTVGPTGDSLWLTIVGVTSALMEGGLEGDTPEAVYLPLAQHPQSMVTIFVRPRAGFTTLPAPIREAVAALDRDVALYAVEPLADVIASANSQHTWLSILFAVSGGIALFLAALGLYGVMAFWVIQRTREIGVRMAVGGQRRDIVRLVLTQGMAQTSMGLGAGVLLALPAALALKSALFGVAPYDPMVFGSVLMVLLTAAWLGCWLPARRATKIAPLVALVAD